MSNPRPQAGSSDGEKRRPAPPCSPLRMRVPELSSAAPQPIELLDEIEAIDESLDDLDTPPTAPQASPKARPKSQPQAAPETPAAAASANGPAEPPQAAPHRAGRRLRFDPPAARVEPASRPEPTGKPLYMTAGTWPARILLAGLWASGGALATAAVIVISLFLARTGGETAPSPVDEPTTPVHWSQEPSAPLRTAAPEVQDLTVITPDPAETPAQEQVAAAPQPPVAQKPPSSEIPLEAPLQPPVAQQETPPVAPFTPPQQQAVPTEPRLPVDGPPLTGHGAREIHNPYYQPQAPVQQPPVQQQTRIQPAGQGGSSQYTPQPAGPQASTMNLPALPADIPTSGESYPRTSFERWKFTPTTLAQRESLRTSMLPSEPTDSEGGVVWPQQGTGQIDGGQYRLQGTIDNVPLR